MDGQLRESGVGDVIVGKRVGQLMSVLGGRLGAYRDALATGDETAMAEAISRNVTLHEGTDPLPITRRVRAFAVGLALVPAFRVLDAEIGK
jgi:cytochrome b pre-mRNA-processing protein 3